MKKLIVVALSFVLLTSGAALAANSISLDSVNVEAIYSKSADPGYTVFEDFGDSVRTGQEIKLYLRYTVDDTTNFNGITNGYRVYVKDMGGDGDAFWNDIPTAPDADNDNFYLETVNGLADGTLWNFPTVGYFSVDGLGADTTSFGGISFQTTGGLPEDYDSLSAILHIGAITEDASSHGDSICVDSSWYRPSNNWVWADPLGGGAFPTWDGPHCFLIIDEATNVEQVPGGEKPVTFRLGQNYPNPFNPVTTISFDVGRTGHVQLDVYNVLGQKVETLINQVMEQGSYEADWEAAEFSTGIYFYKLESGNYSDTKKMLLLK
jgi:hypothetical protein